MNSARLEDSESCTLRCKTQAPRHVLWQQHRGLAPVELVLAIPLVMFTVALSVIVGTASCWKIRSSVVARNEIWTYRMPRDATPPNPRPEGWPVGAAANHYGGGPMAELNH